MHPIRKFYMFILKRSSKNFDEYVERYFSSSSKKILIPCQLGRSILWETPEKLNAIWPVEKSTPQYRSIKDGLRMDWLGCLIIS